MQNNFDAIVIGGGPSGCASAMFLARCRHRTLVIDRDESAGYLGTMSVISCFPGFPESITGRDLLARMKKQAELEGVKFVKDSVTAVAVDGTPKRIMTEKNEEYTANAVIIATGAAMRTNYLHGERELLGKGVSHDAISDGPSVAKRHAAVVGKNRQAVEAALFLSRFADHVYLIIPSNKLDADDAILNKLQKTKNVELQYSTSVKRINGTDHVTSINVLSSGQEKEIHVAGLFTFVHEYQTTTTFVEKAVEMSNSGSIKVDQSLMTTAEGVFACGDVICARPQLPAIAAAQGILAGVNADKFLTHI
jgi:thioredoxin reductase (NADPH)